MKKLLPLFALPLLILACHKDEPVVVTAPKATPYILTIPKGLPDMTIPADNPLTVEGIALGRRLFYDPILSADSTQSCGSCHTAAFSFTDSARLSLGIDHKKGVRNAMPIMNLGWQKLFFWDGGAIGLESQVIGPITNPLEMHDTLPNVAIKLNRHPEYPALFRKAFSLPETEKISIPLLMRAIAQFERTLITANSKYDKWKRGETTLNEQELRGMALYENQDEGDCVHCHTMGSTFSDFEFRNNGLDAQSADLGRMRITLNANDLGKFKTPSLRNIELTAPYMHDGRFQTLDQVLEHYNTGFVISPTIDHNLSHAKKGRLSQSEKDDIVAFLKTLTDLDFVQNKDFQKPF
jgi:cytochrome c peroxidase